jgi:ribosomal protein S8E
LGGVTTNYHTLADFRVANQQALDDLLSQILAALMAEGLVTLRQVAQDGLRTRAGAGASSFRRQDSLEHCLAEAQQQVARLAQEREHPDPGLSRRQQAARERAAREREERVKQALQRLPEIAAVKAQQRRVLPKAKRGKVSEPRASSTDAQATVMKLADGGFRPAYNLEVAADVDSQVIVEVGVVSKGSDGGQALPVAQQLQARVGASPQAYLMDGGFVDRADITALERQGITVYAPTRAPRTTTSGRSQGEARPDDTPEVAAWRARMQTEEAKQIYKGRAATSECVNAHLRRFGLRQLLVRGTDKVLSVLLLATISHNLLRWIALGA